jgi:hypothetical protein
MKMGREVRRVPKNWHHPKCNGNYKPLYEGYKLAAEEFLDLANKEGLQEAIDYMGCPNKEDYMPDWSDEEKTHLMMYEDTTEGTPISPAFKTPEELAQWLTDNGASAFGSTTGTYEGWLRVAGGGYAPSMVLSGGKLSNGVDSL